MSDIAAVDSSTSQWKPVRSGMFLVFGVALPVAALIVELTMRLNTSVFFDPLPTVFHALLVAFVAAANGWGWFVVSREKVDQVRWAGRANAFAMGIALFYSVLFLPLLPIATVGIIYLGLGALAWAPMSSLIVAFRLRVHLVRRAKQHGTSFRSWPGVVLGLAAFIVLDLPATITRVGVRMAAGETVETRMRGMRLLRAVGSEDVLLRMCYVRTGSATDLVSFLINLDHPSNVLRARELYYRVTGRAFNSVLAPSDITGGSRRIFGGDDFDFDQGGSAVGERVRDLWLASSRLDGSVSADAALGYLEWTMVFRNASGTQREARAQIALPPGAVVSRVTLWINGEEREAAFAGRGEVRAAYQAVVQQSRDPVLVTSAGPDRISMQLFPVPPSGEMKVRIGMTFPLALMSVREGVLRLPYFDERNFDVRKELRHGVWIESRSELHSALASSSSNATPGMFRADVSDSRLVDRDASIVARRAAGSVAWSQDMRSAGHVVRQVISDDAVGRPRRVVLVVDGSETMRDRAAGVAKDLAAIPADMDVSLIFAHDGVDPALNGGPLSAAEAAKQITSFDYAGGHDNTTALVRGLDLASGQSDTVLVWIHGPQPVLLETEEPLVQRLSRGPKLNTWYELQVAPGPDLIAEKLDGIASIQTLRGDDLERIVSSWRSGGWGVTVRRERVEASEKNAMPENERTSDHLVRLWANDEVARLVRSGPLHRAEAIELAQQYQLVTPVSGAVVLETQQQYDVAGLQPVPAGTVPTIPEPEEWALILVAVGVLVYAYWRRRGFIVARAG